MKFKNKLFNTHNINIDKKLVFFILSNYINAIVLKLYTIGESLYVSIPSNT